MKDYYRKKKLLLEVLENKEEKEHFHQDIELLYVLSGELDIYIDDQKTSLYRDDVFIVNANKRHSLRGEGDVLYAKLTIMYDLLSDVLNNLYILFICDSTQSNDVGYDGLRRLLRRLLNRYLKNKGNSGDFAYIAICYQIMDFICENFLMRTGGFFSAGGSDKYQLRLQQIENYIQANYSLPISMKQLSEKLYLSNGYLSRFFKKNYGMSFADYLTNVRLHHAVDQLLYTDFPITRIVYDNGFPSVAAFEKAFKKEYGETPSAMRRRMPSGSRLEPDHLPENVEKKLENMFWQDISGKGENFSGVKMAHMSVTKIRPLDQIWKKVINIGSAEDLLRSEVQEHVFLLRESLGFTFVRFWNPFSRGMFIDASRMGHSYNFSRLDSVLDFLQKYNILPFIELESKPKRVVKNPSSSVVYEIGGEQWEINDWKALMEAFMRHILVRYGGESVNQWKFELWFDAERLDDEAYICDYAKRLKITQDIIHQCCEAQLGGCGMHGYSKRDEKKSHAIRDFHEKLRISGVKPDFVTMYAYAYDSKVEDGRTIAVPSSDEHFMEHTVMNMRQDTQEWMKDIPVGLSEWNLTFSDRNQINDTCFKGAYIIKNYIALSGKVDFMAYFGGTDRVSEFIDTNGFLFGGNGLLNKEGVNKPSAFAFHFLNRLYGQYVGKGENYLVSTDRMDNYGIVCHNCKKLSYHYYYTPEDQLDREHISKYFEDMEACTLELKLEDAREGTYKVKIFRVNEEYGSVFGQWQETEFENNLSKDDIRYFQKGCEPKLSMQMLETENGSINLSIHMEANEIAFVAVNYLGK